jgi:3-oxosteroid 1-dehydrogenase
LNSPAEELVVSDDRVTGVKVTRNGRDVVLTARKGVMLAAGGFDRDKKRRLELQGVEGNPAGSPGAWGKGIDMAVGVGADLEYMDDAWWGAAVQPTSKSLVGFLVGERSMPYTIMVDSQGKRFANESESYVDLGHHMLQHDGAQGPYWLIFDARFMRRYVAMFAAVPGSNKAMAAEGIRFEDRTIEGLAGKIGIAPTTLRATVNRFNAMARSGRDHDFHRGDSAYDRYYGDPTIHPNNNLAPIERGPFLAYKTVIADLGTKGGVVTDEFARALRPDGSVIEGLYAAGNTSAAVMGHTYAGPGATIGPASVFGMIAARHLAAAATGRG